MANQTIAITGSTAVDMTGINILVVTITTFVSPLLLTLNNFANTGITQIVVWNQSGSDITFQMTGTDPQANPLSVIIHIGGSVSNITKNSVVLTNGSVHSVIGGVILPSPSATVSEIFMALI